MLIEGYIPQKEFSEEIGTNDQAKAIAVFKIHFGKKVIISAIDEREVEGKCEDCSRFVFSDEEFGSNPEELYVVCPECVEKENAPEIISEAGKSPNV